MASQLRLPRSLPGYYLALFATIVIAMQVQVLYAPAPSMEQLGIKDVASARAIGESAPPLLARCVSSSIEYCEISWLMTICTAFLLIAVNGFTFMAALSDSWPIYRFDLISRIAATGLFWTLGGGWKDLAPIEFGSAVILGLCMYFAK